MFDRTSRFEMRRRRRVTRSAYPSSSRHDSNKIILIFPFNIDWTEAYCMLSLHFCTIKPHQIQHLLISRLIVGKKVPKVLLV